MKILTFVVPAYNSEKFLDKCICSMLAQEVLEELEIIVVNDGSSDTTEAVAKIYCEQYPNVVRLISQENKGHGGALNTGCNAAQGRYLKVIDADDWVETQNLPMFIQLLKNCDSEVILTHHYTIDICTGEIRQWKCETDSFGREHTFDEILPEWKHFEESLTFHGITYSTAFYRKYGIELSEHVFYEDYEYATFPCCMAKSVTPFDLFVYDYRIGDINQSVSDTNQLKRIGHVETVLRRMMQEYHRLTESAGKEYAALKIQSLLLSYLTTALVVNPNKKEGRQLADKMMSLFRENVPRAYNLVRPKYRVLLALNRLHVSKKLWDGVLNSGIYRAVREIC